MRDAAALLVWHARTAPTHAEEWPLIPPLTPAPHLLQLRDKIVSDTNGAKLTMSVPRKGIWGTAGVGGDNLAGCVAWTDCGGISLGGGGWCGALMNWCISDGH